MKRLFLLSSFLFLFSFNVFAQTGRDIPLSSHPATVNADLIKALELRRTTRSYQSQPIGLEDLSAILWAANGINRPDGKRTAPTAHGRHYINIYVADDHGVYLYDPIHNELLFKISGNVKGSLSGQGHVHNAPVVFIFTTEVNNVPGMFSQRESRLMTAHVTAGTMIQNIYLMCAALNIGTGLVGGINSRGITKALHLPDNEIPLYVMPAGYLKN